MNRDPVSVLWVRVVALVAPRAKGASWTNMFSFRAFGVTLLTGTLGMWNAPSSFAQTKSDWDGWRAISHIKGVATAENTSHDKDVDEGTTQTNGFASYHFELIPAELTELELLARVRVPGMPSAIDLARMKRASTLDLGWEAMEAPTVSDQYHHFNTGARANPGATLTIDFDYNGKVQRSDINSGAQFSINLRNGTWNFHALQSEYEKPAEMTVVSTGEDGRTWTEKRIRAEVFIINADQPLPKQPQPLTASSKLTNSPIDTHPNAGGSRTYNVRLWPEFEDVKLDVIVADYEKWRPLGNIANPKKPGNRLQIVAELKPRDKNAITTARPKSITFELKDTSHEPGVCLNWPLGAKDKDPDLKLAEDSMYSGKPDDTGQKLIVKDPKTDDRGFYIGQSQIESYDFGSRAELYVTAQMEDGRTIVGTMKTDKGDDDLVNLPKGRKDGDWIAMSWRKDHDVVDIPDDDDSEDDPKGDGHKGDGYTLYEEYRGWVEKGKHIEGDPKKKDFFVLKLNGVEADAGIAVFENISELKVHSSLLASEMSEKLRLMNGNHRDAPHRVDQHGVWIKKFATASELGGTGAYTVGLQKNSKGGFRPGMVKGIGILGRDDKTSDFNKPYNLSAKDQFFAYDRAIAHELLHTVGVEHHGTGNGYKWVSFFAPENRNNPTGKPMWEENDGWHRPISLYLEDHTNYADLVYPAYKALREKLMESPLLWDKLLSDAAQLVNYPGYTRRHATVEDIASEELDDIICHNFMMRYLEIGAPTGECSGNQDCIMRYYNVNAYPVHGKENEFYLTQQGTEPIGMELCHSAIGTGVNAKGRDPQPRYYNAAEGDCAGQICPNDAIPPK